jgi:hypothetical protein
VFDAVEAPASIGLPVERFELATWSVLLRPSAKF